MGVGVRGRIAGSTAGVPDANGCQCLVKGRAGLPVHRIPDMAYQENGGGRSFRWGSELHDHFTSAAHGLQSAPPCGCHQGRHAPPDAHRWDETRILCRRPWPCWNATDPGVEGCCVPIGVWLKIRKRLGLCAICEQQGPDTAGGSVHHCRTGLAGGKCEGGRELSARTTTPSGTSGRCKCRW